MSQKDRDMERPDAETLNETAERTRLALEKITNGKIKAAQPKNVPKTNTDSEYIRYTPANQSADGGKQRIIKMSTVQEDPLEPPRFKHKKIPRGPTEPPPPVMQSPPRAVTAQDQKDWMIPPCISNWKNNKGYTIPLDKRLAADGRGLQDVHINDNFAKFSEALYVADRHAREEVRARSQMQQLLAQKEKAQKEENLRLLAQRARDERAGLAPIGAVGGSADAASRLAPVATGVGLGGYASDSDEDESEDEKSDEDDEAVREREQVRAEKRREREKEMRMSNMGSEMRAKLLAKWVSCCIQTVTTLTFASGSRTEISRRKLHLVSPNPARPRRLCSTLDYSTEKLCRMALRRKTRTTCTTSHCSKGPVPPRRSTSLLETLPVTTKPLVEEQKRVSRRNCRKTDSRLATQREDSKALPAERSGRVLCNSRRMSWSVWMARAIPSV